MSTAVASVPENHPFHGKKLNVNLNAREGENVSVLSPCANLGRDFELLVNRCIAEKRAQEKRLALDRRKGQDNSIDINAERTMEETTQEETVEKNADEMGENEMPSIKDNSGESILFFF